MQRLDSSPHLSIRVIIPPPPHMLSMSCHVSLPTMAPLPMHPVDMHVYAKNRKSVSRTSLPVARLLVLSAAVAPDAIIS